MFHKTLSNIEAVILCINLIIVSQTPEMAGAAYRSSNNVMVVHSKVERMKGKTRLFIRSRIKKHKLNKIEFDEASENPHLIVSKNSE